LYNIAISIRILYPHSYSSLKRISDNKRLLEQRYSGGYIQNSLFEKRTQQNKNLKVTFLDFEKSNKKPSCR